MANQDIKEKIRMANVPQWKIALELGVCEMTFIRWMRTELPEEKRSHILTAISNISTTKK